LGSGERDLTPARRALLLLAMGAVLVTLLLVARQRRARPRMEQRASPPAVSAPGYTLVPAAAPADPVAASAVAREPVEETAVVATPAVRRPPLLPDEALLQLRVQAGGQPAEVALFSEDDVLLARRAGAGPFGAEDEVLTVGEDGRAEVRVHAGARYRVRARLAGTGKWPTAFRTAPVLEPGDVRLMLVTAEGAPEPGCHLRIVDERWGGPVGDARVAEQSNQRTVREFPVRADGWVTVGVGRTVLIEAPGYAAVTCRPERTDQVEVVALARPGTLTVLVVDAAGNGLGDQRVRLETGARGPLEKGTEGTTGADGTCTFEDVPPHVALSLQVNRTAGVPLVVLDQEGLGYAELREVRIEVTPGASLEGTVLGPDGLPLEGITVSLWAGEMDAGDTWPPGGYVHGLTDGEGRFSFDGLAPGIWSVGSGRTRTDVALQGATLSILGAEHARVELRGWRGLRLEGRLETSAGEPLDLRLGLMIRAQADGHSWAQPVRGDTFVLGPMIDAPYHLRLFQGRRLLTERTGVRPSDEPLRIVVGE
jgi:hypothetical protein